MARSGRKKVNYGVRSPSVPRSSAKQNIMLSMVKSIVKFLVRVDGDTNLAKNSGIASLTSGFQSSQKGLGRTRCRTSPQKPYLGMGK